MTLTSRPAAIIDGAPPIEAQEEAVPRFVSIGECIVELFGDAENGYRLSFQGAASEIARSIRRQLDTEWSVELVTALGDDVYSQRIVDDLSAAGVGTDHVLRVAGRNIGLRLAGDPGPNGPLVTSWRDQAAARLLAEDLDALGRSLSGADAIFVSGGAFAILAPRARGRLLKVLDRARASGARIVLLPLEWPDLWTSDRVLGSAINCVASLADFVFTASAGERAVYGDANAEAVAARYRDWGVEEILVRKYDQGVFISTPAGQHWVDADTTPGSDHLNSAYLAARLQGLAPEAAAGRMRRRAVR